MKFPWRIKKVQKLLHDLIKLQDKEGDDTPLYKNKYIIVSGLLNLSCVT
jgi:hypothetical protein